VTLSELQALERDYVVPTYARLPVELVRGEGARLWDDEGNEYLDFLSGISVTSVGHCHPKVVEAIRAQAGRLTHTTNLFYTEPPMRLAQRLSERSLGGKVFFTNSGAEAIECAIKLARKHRRGGHVVVLEGGFHGRTMGSLSATPQPDKQEPFAPLVPGFRVVPRDDPGALSAAVGEGTAAVLIEPVQGETGVWPSSERMLLAARGACDEAGALLIFDEIQCGMGRTGTLWAFELTPVRPDVLTSAKALANGLPVGACIAGRRAAGILQPGDHGATFGGGPVVAAAALATLGVLDDDALLSRVRVLGDRLRVGLEELRAAGRLADVRGRGLMLAADVPAERDGGAPAVVARALDAGIVLNATGPVTVRFLPPLVVTERDVDRVLAFLDEAL
jgi:acetylornithine/N-succinyldiaminopimelate aminotransferase